MTGQGSARMRVVGGTCALALFLGALSACFSDPESDPAQAEIGVVLDGCLLTQRSVDPGTYRVGAVRYQGDGPGRLVVTDEMGREVLAVESGGVGQLLAQEETYAFTCTIGDVVTVSLLESAP